MYLNINEAECIQSINNFGSTTYKNICNGELQTVPWGSMDWFLVIICFIGLILMVSLFISLFNN